MKGHPIYISITCFVTSQALWDLFSVFNLLLFRQDDKTGQTGQQTHRMKDVTEELIPREVERERQNEKMVNVVNWCT